MKNILHISLLIFSVSTYGQHSLSKDSDYLYRIWDTVPIDRYGYVDSNGDTVIPFDKYEMCFTDTIKQFGIVFKSKEGFIGIDKQENMLFEIFPYDNGPDIPSDGLFRIIRNGKIGYANTIGQIIIGTQFDCAFPFKNGYAKVSNDCKEIKEGEHTRWSGDWFYIDRLGNRITNDSVIDLNDKYLGH